MELHEKEMRQVYGETLVELAGANPHIVVLEADLMKASGTTVFKKAFPGRFVDTGVSEANMIGIAAGLSTLGKIPFCASFTPFASRRVDLAAAALPCAMDVWISFGPEAQPAMKTPFM